MTKTISDFSDIPQPDLRKGTSDNTGAIEISDDLYCGGLEKSKTLDMKNHKKPKKTKLKNYLSPRVPVLQEAQRSERAIVPIPKPKNLKCVSNMKALSRSGGR